jgi:hypothetical protein
MNEYRSLKDIAATVRLRLKAELPQWKFSVRVQHNLAIALSLMSGPEQVEVHPNGYAQLNQYTFFDSDSSVKRDGWNNGCHLTKKGWEVMEKATEILGREHWDKSDIQTDYFCCAFYMHVEIGRWDRDYEVKK